jgi:hypothetical protein
MTSSCYIHKEIRKRDRLRKKYLLIKNDSSKELYKRQRNLVNNEKKQAKEKFYANVYQVQQLCWDPRYLERHLHLVHSLLL